MRHLHRALALGLLAILCTGFAPLGLAADATAATAPTAAQYPERRLALVIGNAAYRDAPLVNPVNDAREVARALRESGFEVTLLEDAKLREIRIALREFGDLLRDVGGAGLFYFAGHGVMVKGRNYLIPIGAEIEREDEVEFESLDANLVLEKLDSAGNRFNIVIFDACRINPFARAYRSTAQGLAPMEAPSGTVVAFSTAPGSVVSDGPGRNGLYTKNLVEVIGRPGLTLEDVFKQVRASVRRDSGGTQVPWESTSLEGEFFFHPIDTAALKAERTRAEKARFEAAISAALASERERLMKEYGVTPDQLDRSKIPAPQFSVGDEWETRSTNNLSGNAREPKPTFAKVTVTRVSEQRVTLSRTLFDRFGGTSTGQPTAYSASQELGAWFDPRGGTLIRGKMLSFPLDNSMTWSYSYEYLREDGTKTREDIDCTVVGWENVTVPAGTFEALRIEQKGLSSNISDRRESGNSPATARKEVTLWYVPDVKFAAKSIVRTFRPDASGSSAADTVETVELVRFALSVSNVGNPSGAQR